MYTSVQLIYTSEPDEVLYMHMCGNRYPDQDVEHFFIGRRPQLHPRDVCRPSRGPSLTSLNHT